MEMLSASKEGFQWPAVGLGIYQATNKELRQAVEKALELGYRAFDTAPYYGNEAQLGDILRHSGLKRETLRIATKLPNGAHRYADALKACELSMKALQTDYLDLYMIHWPMPVQNLYPEAWKALLSLRDKGCIRFAAVSNFTEVHLRRLYQETGEYPVLNQVELHPLMNQEPLRTFCQKEKILVQAYAPLMSAKITEGKAIETLDEIAAHHQRTRAQIILRWDYQNGVAVIPKSVNAKRLEENIRLFDFKLSESEMEEIRQLHQGFRLHPDPDRMEK